MSVERAVPGGGRKGCSALRAFNASKRHQQGAGGTRTRIGLGGELAARAGSRTIAKLVLRCQSEKGQIRGSETAEFLWSWRHNASASAAAQDIAAYIATMKGGHTV
jgi:hypothetical protein